MEVFWLELILNLSFSTEGQQMILKTGGEHNKHNTHSPVRSSLLGCTILQCIWIYIKIKRNTLNSNLQICYSLYCKYAWLLFDRYKFSEREREERELLWVRLIKCFRLFKWAWFIVSDSVDLLLDFVDCGSGPGLEYSVLIIRNMCCHCSSKPKLLANGNYPYKNRLTIGNGKTIDCCNFFFNYYWINLGVFAL